MIINKLGALLRQKDVAPVAFAARVRKSKQWIYELLNPQKSVNCKTIDMICETLNVRESEVIEHIPNALAVLWAQGMPVQEFAKRIDKSPAWVVEHFPPREEPPLTKGEEVIK